MTLRMQALAAALATAAATLTLAAPPSVPQKAAPVDAAGFARDVAPVLKNTCSGCHNASMTSGGVNLLPYIDPTTVQEERAAWNTIVQKIESGEMPPKGVPRPSQDK